jgi:DNA modification methylase
MTYQIFNVDNMKVSLDRSYDVIFADFVYENSDFLWIDKFWPMLRYSGVLICMTDFHTIFDLGRKLMSMQQSCFVNHLVWKNEWGNHPKDRFHQCFDDIVIVSKGYGHVFNPTCIQVPKATAKTSMNPSGRQTKTATAFIDDICLTTTSSERVKQSDGHLVKWQKPLKLMQRIIEPFTSSGDSVLDLFMGSGTLGEWCIRNDREYTGIEIDPEVFTLARTRLESAHKEIS